MKNHNQSFRFRRNLAPQVMSFFRISDAFVIRVSFVKEWPGPEKGVLVTSVCFLFLLQCKDLYLASGSGDHPGIRIKGTITLPKPVQFKSSVKEGTHVSRGFFLTRHLTVNSLLLPITASSQVPYCSAVGHFLFTSGEANYSCVTGNTVRLYLTLI